MKRTRKYFPVLAAATLAAGLAITTAPASRAQAQSDTTASSTTQPSADTQQRLQDLEKEMLLLQKEIVSLKESETPSMKTAAYTQPSAADASPAVIDQAPAAAPAAATAVNLAGLLGPTTISGFVDALRMGTTPTIRLTITAVCGSSTSTQTLSPSIWLK